MIEDRPGATLFRDRYVCLDGRSSGLLCYKIEVGWRPSRATQQRNQSVQGSPIGRAMTPSRRFWLCRPLAVETTSSAHEEFYPRTGQT
jgi:hypothetical protein